MRTASTHRTQRVAGRIVGVALLIALVLGLGLVASSATLHKKICPNAGKPGDSCAVAAFAGGAVAGSPTPALAVAFVVLVTAPARWTDEAFPYAPLFRLSPSRAPPRSGVLPG
jgi:hypothetical protein